MGLFDFLKPKKQKSAWEALNENPVFQQQKAIHDMMNLACASGCDGDELPDGHGEFGLVPTNPIPTNTIQGSKTYLSRLVTVTGKKIEYRRRGATRSEVSTMPIDVYDLFLPDGIPLGTIYISPYHRQTSTKAPRGFRVVGAPGDAASSPSPNEGQSRGKYQIQAVINDFHSFLAAISGQMTQRPEYAELKATWPGLLRFLQPIVTGELLYSEDARNIVAPRFVREETSITDERATERAIYFGLMAFTTLFFNKQRGRYPKINLDKLAAEFQLQAYAPMESLEGYGATVQAARPKIEAITKHFLIREVGPIVNDQSKMENALGMFATKFLSGVLLGQITDFLTLKDYYAERDASGTP